MRSFQLGGGCEGGFGLEALTERFKRLSGGYTEVEREKSGSKEKVTHELGLNSKTIRVREAEIVGGTAGAEEKIREVESIENTLQPTPGTD